MNQVVLHAHEDYIKEDLEYYFSEQRDKNNQVRPNKKIYSMTPCSSHLGGDLQDGQVGNFFYPMAPNSLERIYIGISISLFANYWGASFLYELLKVLRPGGAIILPVYPEGQAAEKGYWSRSFLENIFISRARWTGFSNITAENDGVMSLRFGRKRPEPMPSSIEWFYQERSNLLLTGLMASENAGDTKQYVQTTFAEISALVWQEYATSAALEKIITDCFGKNTAVTISHIGRDYGLLLNDLLLSPYVNVTQGTTWQIGHYSPLLLQSVSQYFEPICQAKHTIHCTPQAHSVNVQGSNLVVLNNLYADGNQDDFEQTVTAVWANLSASDVLVIYENLSHEEDDVKQLEKIVNNFGQIEYYSAIVASKIEQDVEISQYSLAVEENLRREKQSKQNVFRVLKKI
jgi:hypothetical protein